MSNGVIYKILRSSGKQIIILLLVFVHFQILAQRPNPPIIDSISVIQTPNDGYKTVIGWQPYDWTGFSVDSSGFIVYEVVLGRGYVNPDTISNSATTFYIDYSSYPQHESGGYGLAVFAVKNDTLLSEIFDLDSRNMQLKIDAYDSCSMAINLRWNTYFNYDSSFDDPIYQVIVSSASDKRVEQTYETSYRIQNLVKNENYQIKIHIKGEGWSSTSAPVSFYTNSPPLQKKPIIRKVSTSHDFHTEVFVEVDELNAISTGLFAAKQLSGVFELSDSIKMNSEFVSLNQAHATPEVYDYLVQSWDICGNVAESEPVSSIFLSGVQMDSYVRLFANDIFDYEGVYKLVRTVNNQDEVFNLEPPLGFTDTEVLSMALDNPRVTYRIVFNHNDSLEVISNPFTIRVSDDLQWPNAIIAGHYGIDGAFRPFAERIEPIEYNLKIYSKWGELIFESNNIEKAWRAKYKEEIVMPGAYLYICTYKHEGKKARTVKGTVTVIH